VRLGEEAKSRVSVRGLKVIVLLVEFLVVGMSTLTAEATIVLPAPSGNTSQFSPQYESLCSR